VTCREVHTGIYKETVDVLPTAEDATKLLSVVVMLLMLVVGEIGNSHTMEKLSNW
jgi:hypothetical protein